MTDLTKLIRTNDRDTRYPRTMAEAVQLLRERQIAQRIEALEMEAAR